MHVDQPTQFEQRVHRDSWFQFVSELITDLGIQHPIGYCYLHAAWEPDNQNCRFGSP